MCNDPSHLFLKHIYKVKISSYIPLIDIRYHNHSPYRPNVLVVSHRIVESQTYIHSYTKVKDEVRYYYNDPPNCVDIVHFGPRVFTTLKCIYMLRRIHTCSTSGTFFLYLMWDITLWISLTPKP